MTADQTPEGSTRRRAAANESAAALVRGPVELLDFLLPLWAGAALGAGPAEIGLLVALETLTSFFVRPIAGVLADRYDRGRLAATGALLYGVSFAGYVAADSLALAYPAALFGGVGGALFWVALRARVGEGLASDDASYAKLFAAEGAGTWIAFVAGLSLVQQVGYRGVYAVAGAACVLAAVVLLMPAGLPATAPGPHDGSPPGLREVGRRIRPLLVLVAVTAVAESGVALLLLLHLQRGHGLQLGEIAAVFLPGFIVYTVLPEYLHGFVRRFGRTRLLAGAMTSSAAFAVVLSFAPNPAVIAGLWILSAVAYAAAIPTQQSIVAEAAGLSLGRGMGVYESATLLGATIGAAAAGVLYGTGGNGWQGACLGAGGVLLVAALLVRPAIRAVGVQDRPGAPAQAGSEAEPDRGAERPEVLEASPPPAGKVVMTKATTVDRPSRHRAPVIRWAQHLALFVVGQAVLALIGESWPLDTLRYGVPDGITGWNWVLGNDRDTGGLLSNASRIWCLVLLADTAWTGGSVALRRRGATRDAED